jgi:hypothetical protein
MKTKQPRFMSIPTVPKPCRNAFSSFATTFSGTALLIGLLILGTGAQAQTYSIDGSVMGGGGGTSTGGRFAVSGTVGQPEANAQALTGGPFSLLGGFWSLFAVQTPGAPFLSITLDPQFRAVTVSWPSPSTGFVLQQTADLNVPNWVAVPQPVNDSGTSKFIVVNSAGGNRFYRLFKP